MPPSIHNHRTLPPEYTENGTIIIPIRVPDRPPENITIQEGEKEDG